MTTESPSLNFRQQKLLDYFLDVARDVAARGIRRQKPGQSLLDLLIDILKSEPRLVLGQMSEDVAVVMRVLGIGLARSKLVGDIASQVFGAVTDRVVNAIAGRRR